MTLEEQIKTNTQRMAELKQQMEVAISDKGGVITPSGDTPTFEEVIAGVDTIETGVTIAGAVNVKAKFLSKLNKGDTCSLTPIPVGSYTLTSDGNPLTAIDGDSTVTINLYQKPTVWEGGKYALFFSGNYAYPFVWSNKKYVQMTINGVYTHFSEIYLVSVASAVSTNNEASTGCYACGFWGNRAYCCQYDNPILSIYDIVENDLVLHGKYALEVPANYWFDVGLPMVYNNNIWLTGTSGSPGYTCHGNTVQFYFDEEADTLTYVTNVGYYVRTNVSWGYQNMTMDITADAEGAVYMYVYSRVSNDNTQRLVKLELDANGVYQKTVSQPSVLTVSGREWYYNGLANGTTYTGTVSTDNYSQVARGNCTLFHPYYVMERGCKYLFSNNGNVLKVWSVNSSTLAITALTVSFADGLTNSSIVGIRLVKDANLLYVYTTNSAIDDADKVKLYSYIVEGTTITFTPIASVARVSTPAIKPLVLPYILPYVCQNLVGIPFQVNQSFTNVQLYVDPSQALDYDYTAKFCNNLLEPSSSDVKAYGVSQEDAEVNDIGDVSLIFTST